MRPPVESAEPLPDKRLAKALPDLAHHLPTDNSPSDLGLATVADAWPRLSESLRTGILAMVRAAIFEPNDR
jgi:hypothetical protein